MATSGALTGRLRIAALAAAHRYWLGFTGLIRHAVAIPTARSACLGLALALWSAPSWAAAPPATLQDPLTIADMFRWLAGQRGLLLAVALIFPAAVALVSEMLRGGDNRKMSLFVADAGLTTSLLLVCVEVMALLYYRLELRGDVVRDIDIVLLFAPLFTFAATLGLISFIHPLGSLATIRRIQALAMFVVLAGVLLFILARTRIWVVFYGRVIFFLLLLAVLIYFIRWYFKRFLVAD